MMKILLPKIYLLPEHGGFTGIWENILIPLPQQKALTFFYGPIALARDIRVSGANIFSPIYEPGGNDIQSIKLMNAPKNIWKEFVVDLGNKQVIHFCDFSSAGNTWDKNSLFNTWCILKN